MVRLTILPSRLAAGVVVLLFAAATAAAPPPPQLVNAQDAGSISIGSRTPIEPQLGGGGAREACDALRAEFPGQTFSPNATEGYAFETRTQYWSALNYKNPACVFVPRTARQVSSAVTTFTRTGTRFAVRGGGHMPIVGSNSIDSDGVLLSLSGLNTLKLSEDGRIVSVGPGNRWRDVYGFLEPHALTAVGGRGPYKSVQRNPQNPPSPWITHPAGPTS